MMLLDELKKVYDHCRNDIANYNSGNPLSPIFHTIGNVDVTIRIDGKGNFISARYNDKENELLTIFPSSEESLNRTSNVAPHALVDSCMYLDKNVVEYLPVSIKNNLDTRKKSSSTTMREDFVLATTMYLENLTTWCASSFSHPAARSILAYVKKQTVVQDIKNTLHFIDNWDAPEYKNSENVYIYRYNKYKKSAKKDKKELCKLMVRWEIQYPGGVMETWKEHTIFDSWIQYYLSSLTLPIGTCMVTGDTVPLTTFFQKNIPYAGDSRKIISSNDSHDFRDKFKSHLEAYSVGVTTAHESHNALRYLIRKQGIIKDSLVFVAWESGSGATVDLLDASGYISDTMADEAKKINSLIKGKSNSESTQNINALCLDSTCKGRFSVTFFDTYEKTDFYDNIKNFYETLKVDSFNTMYVPSISDIIFYGYGKNLSDSRKKELFKRIVTAMLNGEVVPPDITTAITTRALRITKRNPKLITIACSLYNQQRRGSMFLDHNCTDRSYLYGRLVGVAEVLERHVLTLKKEKRETNAIRFFRAMQQSPYTTWVRLACKLTPYKAYLARKNWDIRYEKMFGEIFEQFNTRDFKNDDLLTSMYLMGYHQQKAELYKKNTDIIEAESNEDDSDE